MFEDPKSFVQTRKHTPSMSFLYGAGADDLVLYSGTVTPNITMAEGVIPRIKSTSAITEA